MVPTELLTDAVSPENDARNCVPLPLLIVASSVVKEVIAAGPGTVVVVVGATVVVVVVLVDVVVVEVEVVVVVGTRVVVVVVLVVGATVVADAGALGVVVVVGAGVVVGTTDVEVVVSSVATVVDTGGSVTVVRLAEGVVPDSIGEAEMRGVFIAAVISTETKIADFVKPFGHFAVDLQRICLVVDLVQIGSTPFGAFFDALVVLDKHLPVRENCNALLLVMQTVLAVLVVHEIFDSDFPHAPVFETLKIT